MDATLASESGQPEFAEAVASGKFKSLPDRMQALCRYALKLTVSPWAMKERSLRQTGRRKSENRVSTRFVISLVSF